VNKGIREAMELGIGNAECGKNRIGERQKLRYCEGERLGRYEI